MCIPLVRIESCRKVHIPLVKNPPVLFPIFKRQLPLAFPNFLPVPPKLSAVESLTSPGTGLSVMHIKYRSWNTHKSLRYSLLGFVGERHRGVVVWSLLISLFDWPCSRFVSTGEVAWLIYKHWILASPRFWPLTNTDSWPKKQSVAGALLMNSWAGQTNPKFQFSQFNTNWFWKKWATKAEQEVCSWLHL